MNKIMMSILLIIYVVIVTTLMIMMINLDTEKIKQLKQSNIEIQQECEVYRNRCLKLENMLEGTGLVVDNCECK